MPIAEWAKKNSDLTTNRLVKYDTEQPAWAVQPKKRGRGPDKKKRAPGSGGARRKPGVGPRVRLIAITLRVPPAVAEAFKAGASAAGMSQPKFFEETVRALDHRSCVRVAEEGGYPSTRSLSWGVDGYGARHYLCTMCGEVFGKVDPEKISHKCKPLRRETR